MPKILAAKLEKSRLSDLDMKGQFLEQDERKGKRNVLSAMGRIAVWLREEILKPHGFSLNHSLATY